MPNTPTEPLSAPARRAIRGGIALSARHAVAQGVHALGSLLIAGMVSPSTFGLWVVAIFISGLLPLAGLGLGSSLVRRPQDPDDHERAVVTSAQLLIATVLAAVVVLGSSVLVGFYAMPASAAWLFRAAAFSLLLTPLQTLAIVRLERSLAFGRIAVVEAAQAVAFNGVGVTLAIAGAGEWSAAGAVLAKTVVGVLLLLPVARPIRSFRWDISLLRSHLAFGLEYQGAAFFSMAKDAAIPVLIGAVAGASAVGLVGWAQMVAAYPLLALMALQRLYFPVFARLQDDRHALGRLMEQIVFATNAIVSPLAVVTLILIEPATPLLFGSRWMPALPLLHWLWLANLVVPTATPALAMLAAVGRPRVGFVFAAFWMIATWALSAPLVLSLGVLGFGIANAIVQLSNLPLIRIAQRAAPFRVVRTISPPWVYAGSLGIVLAFVTRRWDIHDAIGVAASAGVMLILYAAGMLVFYRDRWQTIATWSRREAA
jgi:O-antigen/teichoic acid export membrane protein